MGWSRWSYGLTVALFIATMFGAGRWTVVHAAHASLGADWVVESVVGSSINDAAFLDGSTGFAVGDGGIIRVTHDGGATWSSYVSGTTDNLSRIIFDSSTDGYIAGDGVLLHTSNSGASWQQITSSSLPGAIQDIAVPAPNTIYVVAQPLGPDGVFVSTDGGANWQLLYNEGSLNRIVFTSASNGWLAGSNGLENTSDGGQNWNSVNIGDGTGYNFVVFADPSHGYAAGGNSIARTTDGGQTWTEASLPDSVSNVVPSGASQALAIVNGSLYASSDGGATWTQQSTILDRTCDMQCHPVGVIGYRGGTPFAIQDDKFLHYGSLPAQPTAQPTTPPVPVATTLPVRAAPTQTASTLTLQSVSPHSIPHGTTPTITINGRGFDGLATISIGSIDITNVQYHGGLLRFTLPNNVGVGTYDITITEPSGRSATLHHALTIYRPLTISLRALHPSVTQGAQEIILAQTDGGAKVSAQVALSNGHVLPHLRTTLQVGPHGQWRLLIATDQHTPKSMLRATLSAREGSQHTQASAVFKVVAPVVHGSK